MNRLIFVVFLCLTITGVASAKSVNLDSLEQILPTLQGEIKIQTLVRLALGHRGKEVEKAEGFAREALNLAFQTENLHFQALSYDILGQLNDQMNKQIVATDCFVKGLEIAKQIEGQSRLVPHLHNSCGFILAKQGEFNRALNHYLQGKSICEESGIMRLHGQILSNLGTLYNTLEEYDKAIDVLSQSLRLGEQLGPKGQKIRVQALNNLGTVYEDLALYDRALECYERALEISMAGRNPISKIASMVSLFSIHVKRREDIEAKSYYKRAFEMAEEEGSEYWLQELYTIYGSFLQEKGDTQEAITYFQKGLSFAKTLKIREHEMNLHNRLAYAYSYIQDYQQAFEHKQAYHGIRDSIFNQTKARQLAEVQSTYDMREMTAELEDMRREEEFARIRMYGLLAMITLFLVALTALYSRYRIRKRSLFLLEEQHKEIEDKNKQLELQSQDIQEKNRKLGEINQELGQFAYAASHDLRQPLRTISSYLDLFKKRYREKLDEESQQFIQYASIGAKRMEKILKDLLTYSQVGRSQIHKEPVDINKVLQQVQYQLALQIAETHTKITYDTLPVLEARPTEMVQLFQNLISNAIKFRSHDRTPYIFIGYEKSAQEHLISISDNGIGIAPEFEKKVFEMFERQYSQDQFEGNGIGLALCKKIVDYHEGRLWFNTVPGEGTTFFLAFPLCPALTPDKN